MSNEFTEFRKDGFPLCPCCGEDELYSLYANTKHCMERQLKGETVSLEETLEYPFACYRCNWASDDDLELLGAMIGTINGVDWKAKEAIHG